MNKIDVTKPLELDDGTPVTFERLSETKKAVVVRLPEGTRIFRDDSITTRDCWYYDLDTGFFYGASNGKTYKTLRNRVPAVDPNKPMELEDGTPVEMVHASKYYASIRILRRPSQWGFSRDWLLSRTYGYDLRNGQFNGFFGDKQLRLRNVQETPKLDWTKPLWTKDGRPAKLLATFPDTETFKQMHPEVGISKGDVRLVEINGSRKAFKENGQLFDTPSEDPDLTNIPPAPARKTFYHAVRTKDGKGDVTSQGRFGIPVNAAEGAIRSELGWSSKVLKITYEGSEPVSVELV